MPIKIGTVFIIATALALPVQAAHLHKESAYRDAWCKGRTEVTLHDGSSVDCLTENYAVEFDFAPKAYEALGQAMHYGRITGHDPAMVLIIEKDSDWRWYKRIRRTALKRHVKLWYITPAHLNPAQAK
jgi:hypothetical protein